MSHTVILPKLWDDCPSWWHNLASKAYYDIQAALAEYNAHYIGFDNPAPDTRIVFGTEQDYTMFLLRWA